jgi:imidazoleglycerol-phosphate dehydratase/histidinol-phosphatase
VIYEFLKLESRSANHFEKNETDIYINLNLDGTGKVKSKLELPFFDHMLDQIARHGQMEILKGFGVDEHRLKTQRSLLEKFCESVRKQTGIERYGLSPMDDCLAQVAIDFGGRNWLVWETEFKREMVGKMPTEMFMHFFKSF